MLASKTRVKTREKREKNARKTREKREKNARKKTKREPNVSILHYALGKNASQLRFSRVFLALFSRFCSQTQTNSIV